MGGCEGGEEGGLGFALRGEGYEGCGAAGDGGAGALGVLEGGKISYEGGDV